MNNEKEINILFRSGCCFIIGLVFGSISMFNTGAKSGYLECINDFHIIQTYIELKDNK